jgi:hypothetical protein
VVTEVHWWSNASKTTDRRNLVAVLDHVGSMLELWNLPQPQKEYIAMPNAYASPKHCHFDINRDKVAGLQVCKTAIQEETRPETVGHKL